MIRRIVSGGQTGADRAALDIAIELGITHGGWVPKGRRTEKGRLPTRYKLKEMADSGYRKRTEQNVIDSDGTLILSHGALKGGSALTREMAKKHERPCLHINLNEADPLAVVKAVHYWLERHDIVTLNVAGPRAGDDPWIYDATREVVGSVIRLTLTGEPPSQSPEHPPLIPTTVQEALSDLISRMSDPQRSFLAGLEGKDLGGALPGLARYIRSTYGLRIGNRALTRSCELMSGRENMSADEAMLPHGSSGSKPRSPRSISTSSLPSKVRMRMNLSSPKL